MVLAIVAGGVRRPHDSIRGAVGGNGRGSARARAIDPKTMAGTRGGIWIERSPRECVGRNWRTDGSIVERIVEPRGTRKGRVAEPECLVDGVAAHIELAHVV